MAADRTTSRGRGVEFDLISDRAAPPIRAKGIGKTRVTICAGSFPFIVPNLFPCECSAANQHSTPVFKYVKISNALPVHAVYDMPFYKSSPKKKSFTQTQSAVVPSNLFNRHGNVSPSFMCMFFPSSVCVLRWQKFRKSFIRLLEIRTSREAHLRQGKGHP